MTRPASIASAAIPAARSQSNGAACRSPGGAIAVDGGDGAAATVTVVVDAVADWDFAVAGSNQLTVTAGSTKVPASANR